MLCVHQEGSGFEDFDSDAEIIRVSDLKKRTLDHILHLLSLLSG